MKAIKMAVGKGLKQRRDKVSQGRETSAEDARREKEQEMTTKIQMKGNEVLTMGKLKNKSD